MDSRQLIDRITRKEWFC